MRKTFLRTILLPLLLLASSGSFAAGFKDIDRGSNSWGSVAYVMAFVARDYVPGHAFVMWLKLDLRRRKFLERYAYGLYPDNRKKAVFGTVPGNIINENLGSLRSANNGLFVAVTKQMYDYSLNNTQAMRSGNVPYHLTKQSCVDFVELTAKAIGLSTPPTSGFNNLPQAFISELKEMNN